MTILREILSFEAIVLPSGFYLSPSGNHTFFSRFLEREISAIGTLDFFVIFLFQ